MTITTRIMQGDGITGIVAYDPQGVLLGVARVVTTPIPGGGKILVSCDGILSLRKTTSGEGRVEIDIEVMLPDDEGE